jgi:hypothetical protein
MVVLALIATVLVFVQNTLMFALGFKESAIFSFPLSFTGIFLAEVASLWAGYFCIRRFLHHKRALFLTGWALMVLAAAELMLPVSYFSTWVQHARREAALNRIDLVGTSIEPLASDRGGIRFALTYTLRFPDNARYLTFPAYLGPEGNRVFGDYFTKVHPEYHDENYSFDAGKPYSFTVIFDTEGKLFDFSREKANIDICDGKDFFMACRIIGIALDRVPAALATNPSPVLREPAVPEGNLRDLEKNTRLDDLRLKSPTTKAGAPVEFSFVVTNIGDKDIAIPGDNLANVIGVNYGWEAISESAKATKVTPGIVRFGNAVAAGGAQFAFVHQPMLLAGARVPFQDKIAPFEPLAPGDYRLHVFLFSRYSTETGRPVQELVRDFSIVP